MDDSREHEIFRRRHEPAKLIGAGVSASVEQHQPISLGAVVLLLADMTDHTGAKIAFGKGETLSHDDCVALKRRYKDDLLLDDAVHGDREIFKDMDRAPGSGTGQGS